MSAIIHPYNLLPGAQLHYLSAEGHQIVQTVNFTHIAWAEQCIRQFNLVHSGIPLTAEILSKWGVRNSRGDWDVNGFILSFITSDDSYQIEVSTPYTDWEVLCFPYVHQFQMFYFVMTGKMLTL